MIDFNMAPDYINIEQPGLSYTELKKDFFQLKEYFKLLGIRSKEVMVRRSIIKADGLIIDMLNKAETIPQTWEEFTKLLLLEKENIGIKGVTKLFQYQHEKTHQWLRRLVTYSKAHTISLNLVKSIAINCTKNVDETLHVVGNISLCKDYEDLFMMID